MLLRRAGGLECWWGLVSDSSGTGSLGFFSVERGGAYSLGHHPLFFGPGEESDVSLLQPSPIPLGGVWMSPLASPGAREKTTHPSPKTSFGHRFLAKFPRAPNSTITVGAVFLYTHPAGQMGNRGPWQDSGTAILPVSGVEDKFLKS